MTEPSKSVTPLTDAYDAGFIVGDCDLSDDCPYEVGSKEEEHFCKGYNAGVEYRLKGGVRNELHGS